MKNWVEGPLGERGSRGYRCDLLETYGIQENDRRGEYFEKDETFAVRHSRRCAFASRESSRTGGK